jgi:uncharacterized protein YlxW (UPF0749 family)
LTEAILGAVGVVIGGVLTYLGVRFTARQSRKAAETSAAVSSRSVDVEEWRAIVEALRGEVNRLSTRVDALEAKGTADRARIDNLEDDRRRLVTYVRELLAWARRVAPSHRPPEPPPRVAEELAA